MQFDYQIQLYNINSNSNVGMNGDSRVFLGRRRGLTRYWGNSKSPEEAKEKNSQWLWNSKILYFSFLR